MALIMTMKVLYIVTFSINDKYIEDIENNSDTILDYD